MGTLPFREGSDGDPSPNLGTVRTPKTNHVGGGGYSLDTLATCLRIYLCGLNIMSVLYNYI